MFSDKDLVKYWSRVDKKGPNECWGWKPSLAKAWYGTTRLSGKMYKTHRVAYILANGPIPDGMRVLHTCDNPPCCNPNHLFLGTHEDNMKDKTNKNRHIHGSQHKLAKLDNEKVLAMREDYETNNYSYKSLGQKYGVGPTLAGKVVKNKAWKHI